MCGVCGPMIVKHNVLQLQSTHVGLICQGDIVSTTPSHVSARGQTLTRLALPAPLPPVTHLSLSLSTATSGRHGGESQT